MGCRPDLYPPGRGAGGYLAFIGRISPEKRPDQAIEIARARGAAAEHRRQSRQSRSTSTYKTEIEPLLANPLIEFIGEIGDDEKGAFLGDAMALLFPIDWPEPFGLAMIEAMANGTPVIAFRRGSVPEIVEPGVTGFIVDSIDEAVAAIPLARALDRTVIRRRFEERFSGRAHGARLSRAVRRGAAARQCRRGTRRGRSSQRPRTTTESRTRAASGMPERRPEVSETPRFYIESSAQLQERRPRALKQGHTFAVFDPRGDIVAAEGSPEGVYHRDTRYLSRLELRAERRAAAAAELECPGRQRRSDSRI